VNFRNTVIIMTSNIGSQHIEKMEKLGFSSPVISDVNGSNGASNSSSNRDRENYNQAKDKVMSSLKDHFRPEFLNRLDDIIIFDILSPEAIREIVTIQVAEVIKRLAEKNIDLVLEASAYEYLARDGYNPQYGARPLRRLIQNKILTPVAKLIIGQELNKGGTITVGMKEVSGKDVGKEAEFTFDVKKKRVASVGGKQSKQESSVVVSSDFVAVK
jgi:ATP-dependent Clp protease ATP-binding subunit ClpA